MLELLERTIERHHTAARDPDMGPAPPPTFTGTTDAGSRWPRNAKIMVVLMAVLTLGSVFGAIITRGGDDTPDPDAALQTQIDDLITERDALLLSQQDLTTELATATARADDVDAQLAVVDAELAAVTAQLAIADADTSTLEANRTALIGQRDDLRDELAAAEIEIAGIEEQLAAEIDVTTDLDVRIAELSDEVNALVVRAVTAETERDALAALFPVTVDTSLEPADVAGTWDVDWTRRYCEGFTTCGNDPGFDSIEIETTAADTLQLVIDGHMTAGLARAEGGLVAIGRSLAAIPACDGVPRVANLSVTIYGLGATMHADGTDTVDQLGATVVVSAVETATCPAGMAAFGAVLTSG